MHVQVPKSQGTLRVRSREWDGGEKSKSAGVADENVVPRSRDGWVCVNCDGCGSVCLADLLLAFLAPCARRFGILNAVLKTIQRIGIGWCVPHSATRQRERTVEAKCWPPKRQPLETQQHR